MLKFFLHAQKGSTACIFRYKPKRRGAIPPWELRTGKPINTIQKHATLSYDGKGCQSGQHMTTCHKCTFTKHLSGEALPFSSLA